jgi:hypothetical protein
MIPRETQIKSDIIYGIKHTPIIRSLNRCLICRKGRIDKDFRKLLWESNFILNYNNRVMVFTICPRCRINSINSIYESLIKRRW